MGTMLRRGLGIQRAVGGRTWGSAAVRMEPGRPIVLTRKLLPGLEVVAMGGSTKKRSYNPGKCVDADAFIPKFENKISQISHRANIGLELSEKTWCKRLHSLFSLVLLGSLWFFYTAYILRADLFLANIALCRHRPRFKKILFPKSWSTLIQKALQFIKAT